ncbi:MAG TPA: DUF5131 family protein, partial [Conexibacter sp.]|nr:DUF5131 family protein [Conexibacter sp.]
QAVEHRQFWKDYPRFDGPQLDLTGIDWLIAGAESGHGARRMDPDWVRDLRDAAEASGAAFFLKQFATPKGRKIPLPELDGRQWKQMPAAAAAREPVA